MRTYEVELTVQTKVKRTITSEKEETHATLTEAAMTLEGFDAEALFSSHVKDVTPKPATDKQRLNAAFKELRKMGFKAKQGVTHSEFDGLDIFTAREDANWSFNGSRLERRLPIAWDTQMSREEQEERVQLIRDVFESHGFATGWDGNFWNSVEVWNA